jgi:hypothetical protein
MHIKKQIIMAALAGILLTSCMGQATQVAGEPTVDVNAVMTAGIGTFIAALTQTQAARATLATQTPSATPSSTASPVALNSITPPSPTSTQAFLLPAPTLFIAPTVTGTQYTATANPSTLGVGCNNLRLIDEVMDPSGPVLQPGQNFIKTWKVENNGTCGWAYLYHLVFVGGDEMEGEPSGPNNPIPPGKWTQLHLSGIAPSRPGSYTGYWRLADQSGTVFGATLTVSITVPKPSYP